MLTTAHSARVDALVARTVATSWRSRGWIAAAAAMFIADLFLHLPITDVCDALVKKFGWVAYDNFVRQGFLTLGALTMIGSVVLPRRRSLATSVAIAALLAAAFVVQRTLLVAGIENIHYPQYAIVTILLLRGDVRPEVGFLMASGLGFLDESYQFTALPRGRPTYFDWNDVVLNALGAAFGLVLARAFVRTDRDRDLLPARRVMAVIGLALVIAFVLEPPALSPFFTATPGGRGFHRLAASEAVLILGCLWMGMRGVLGQEVRRSPAR